MGKCKYFLESLRWLSRILSFSFYFLVGMGPFETSETQETRNFLLFSEPFSSKLHAIYVI